MQQGMFAAQKHAGEVDQARRASHPRRAYRLQSIHIKLYLFLLGQQLSLQGFSYALSPVQGNPSHEGVGLLHDLVTCFIPTPHVLLHDPCVHELHPP